MSQTYNTPDTGAGGDVIKDGFDQLIEMIDATRSNFIGSSAFGVPVNGEIWMDDTDSTDYIPKLYENSGFISLDLKYTLGANKDFSNYQAINFCAENLGGTPSTESTTIGRIIFNTTDGDLEFDDNGVSASYKKVVSYPVGVGTLIRKNIPITSWQADGSNPPTETSAGSSPECKGWLFNATNEKMTLTYPVPGGWIGSSDINLLVHTALNNAETNGDDIDFQVNYIAATGGAGEALDKTSTLASTRHDISTSSGQYDFNTVSIVIDYDDATNPISPYDLLILELKRIDLADITGVIFLGSELQYYSNDLG